MNLRSSDGGVLGAGSTVALAAPAPVTRRQVHRGLRADPALRQRRGVPGAVVAVPVSQMPRPEPLHGRPLPGVHVVLLRQLARPGTTTATGAAAEQEVVELGDVGRVLVVHLVPAPRRGPAGAVPDGGVQRHRLGRELQPHGLAPHHLPDRRLIHVEPAER